MLVLEKCGQGFLLACSYDVGLIFHLSGGQVIVTSYLFPGGQFSLERLQAISSVIGNEKLVVDVRYEANLLSF